MKKLCFLILVLLLSATNTFAQKEYKVLHNYIKSGGQIAPVMQTVQNLEKDEECKDDPKLYFLAALAQRKANDTDNTKIYLKQPYDTVAFFNTTYGMFDYTFKCDEKDRIPNAKGKVKLEYRSKCYNLVKNYWPNLYNGGLFFTRRKDYANGEKFLSMFLDAAESPVFEKDKYIKSDSRRPRAAFWCMAASFEQKKYKEVFKYSDIAAVDTANTDLFLQYRVISYLALKDSAHYEQELIRGMQKVPSDLFFYTNLADFYNSTRQYGKALQLADSLIKLHPNESIYKFAKSVVFYNKKQYDDCIALSQEVLQADTTNADTYFYLGSCYYSKAIELDDKAIGNINSKKFAENKQQVAQLFSQALPYLEKYRALCPNEQNRWAPMLYRTYLTLNMEKKFAEMDKILTEAAAAAKKK